MCLGMSVFRRSSSCRIWTRKLAVIGRSGTCSSAAASSAFARGFYGTGLLGRFIGLSHGLSRLLGRQCEQADECASTLDRAAQDPRRASFRRFSIIGCCAGSSAILLRFTVLMTAGAICRSGRQSADRTAWRVAAKGQKARLRFSHQGRINSPIRRLGAAMTRTFSGGVPPYLEEENFRSFASRIDRVERPSCIPDRCAGAKSSPNLCNASCCWTRRTG